MILSKGSAITPRGVEPEQIIEGIETKTELPNDEAPEAQPIVNKTSTKILEQVQCEACKKYMSAKNLRYSHAKFCTAVREELPQALPVPEKEEGGEASATPAEEVKEESEQAKQTEQPEAKKKRNTGRLYTSDAANELL